MKKVALLAVLGIGCAPALSTFQPAHVAEKGHVQAGAGFDVSVPTGTIQGLLDSAKAITETARVRALTADEQKKVFDAGINLAVNPPSFGPHANVAYTPVDRLEVGIRWASSAWRLGTRYQFLKAADHGIDMTLGLGLARYTYKFPVSDQIPYLTIDDFSRWQLDLPLLFGKKGDWYRWWAGPKVMLTSFKTSMQIDAPSFKSEIATFSGTGGYYAAQGGFALGYKKVFLGFELTIARLWGHANTTLLSAAQRTEVDSFIIYPSVGLMGEF